MKRRDKDPRRLLHFTCGGGLEAGSHSIAMPSWHCMQQHDPVGCPTSFCALKMVRFAWLDEQNTSSLRLFPVEERASETFLQRGRFLVYGSGGAGAGLNLKDVTLRRLEIQGDGIVIAGRPMQISGGDNLVILVLNLLLRVTSPAFTKRIMGESSIPCIHDLHLSNCVCFLLVCKRSKSP